MNILGINITRAKKKGRKPDSGNTIVQNRNHLPALANNYTPMASGNAFVVSFDGEKNAGDIGPVKRFLLDHDSLRYRSWQLYLESEICQIVFNRVTTWVVGAGLKLRSEPQKEVLNSEGITVPDTFVSIAEARFATYAQSKIADLADLETLGGLAEIAFMNSIVGSDCLVILRVINSELKVQLIDGCNVATPYGLSFTGFDYVSKSGNKVKNGIEMDKYGKHIAYYVRNGIMDYVRVPAYSPGGQRLAFLVHGARYRIENNRSIPLITAVMETASKLERYKEATLGSAEEAAKVALTIEHKEYSTGENPLDELRKASGFNKSASGDNPVDINHTKLLDNVVATTGKQAINLPLGATMSSLESKKELYFNDFFTINSHLVFSTVGIPPEVAMMKYDSNFSASRAALKDWEHTLNVKRDKFSVQFYQPIYELWLYLEILKGKISAPGLMKEVLAGNAMVKSAYCNARFVGAKVPHIDPVKEVTAERMKLGDLGGHMPMTTLEAATENLAGGNSYNNMELYADELAEAERLRIMQAPKKAPDQSSE